MKIAPKQTLYILEIIGMAFILGATCWQLFFVDTLEEMVLNTRYIGIERMLDGVLININKNSQLHLYNNNKNLKDLCNTINRQTWSTILNVRSEKIAREKLRNGQTAFLKKIRAGLFILGSILLIVGKAIEADIACGKNPPEDKIKTPLKE